jgi:hypothetical protein
MVNQGGRIGLFETFILLKNRHSLKRVVPTMNLVKFSQIWQLKKIIWGVLSLFSFVINHSK